MSMPTKLDSAEPAQIASRCRLARPPISGVPVPGANAVERIDVEAEVGGRVADDCGRSFGDGAGPQFVNVLAVMIVHALDSGRVVDRFLNRRTDPDLHACCGSINRSSMDVEEHRAVA